MSKKILITGANGQLGQSIKKLSENNNDMFYFHDVDTLDLTDTVKLKEYVTGLYPDFIVNCAAYNLVDKAEEDSQTAFLLNSDVPGNLAVIAHETGSHLIHISTDYVFDGMQFKPYTEEDNPNPVSVYGKSKFEGESKVMAFPRHSVIRTSWLYSEYGNNFVKTILRLGKEKNELKVISDQVGSPTYATDLAKAILSVISEKYISGIYHYSNEGVCSWFDFAHEIIEQSGIECDILPIDGKDYPSKAKRPYYSLMSKNKIKSVFQLEIPHWKASLKTCIENITA